jgi:probable F420-dependent oxidoreductase
MSPVSFASAAELRGFESVFFPDHTHVPRASVTASTSGEGVPSFYRTVMDPIAVLGAVASTTSSIRIGTAIALVTERDPIILAKQIATIDQLSGGRVVFGVGAGSNEHELRNHGTDPNTRFVVLRERLEAMSAIWRDDIASYSGRFVHFDDLWSWPKPVQRPRPPILLGGGGPTVLDRVVEYADGWLPFRAGTEQVLECPKGLEEPFERRLAYRINVLRQRARRAGRRAPSVTLFNPLPHRDALCRYADYGVDRVVFWLPTALEDVLLPTLDALAALGNELIR